MTKYLVSFLLLANVLLAENNVIKEKPIEITEATNGGDINNNTKLIFMDV